METRDLVREAISVTWEKVQELEGGSKERKFMEETLCKLVELDNQRTKIEYDEYSQEQRIDADKEKAAADIRMRMEQFQAERKRSWIPSADAILITVIFSLMTLILYVIEGKGIIAPRAAKTLEKLIKFVRIA